MDDILEKYREHLVEARQKAFESFDRTLLTLSAGGLALSLSFVKEFSLQGRSNSNLLVVAWVTWVLSLALTLTSFYASQLALRKAIQQVDDRTISATNVGGRWTTTVYVLNGIAGISFLVGLSFIIGFVCSTI